MFDLLFIFVFLVFSYQLLQKTQIVNHKKFKRN